jgi:hypothetical protein
MRPDAGARNRAFSSGPLPVERFFQFSLLGLVASGYLAVAGSAYLDVPTTVLTGGGILLRALLLAGLLRLNLTERTATIVAVGYAGFFPIDYFFLSHDFLSSTVHLVFFLAVVKILTAKTNRDNLYIAVIAFLELLAAAILSIDVNFFLCLALFLLFAIAALTSGEIRRSMHKAPTTARAGLKRFHSRLAILAVWIALGILTLTAGMFFLLPRTADAALSTLISHHIRVPGFSDHVTLGEIGEFKNSSRPVLHIAIYGNQPMGSAKWRGDVLTDFDGRAWSRSAPGDNYLTVNGGHISLGYRPGLQRSYRVGIAHVVFRRGSGNRRGTARRNPRGIRIRLLSSAPAARLGLPLRRLERPRRAAGNHAAAQSSAHTGPATQRAVSATAPYRSAHPLAGEVHDRRRPQRPGPRPRTRTGLAP